MKSKRILISLFVPLVLLLVAVVGLTYAQDLNPFSSSAPQAPLGSSFTYQGELKVGGELVNETCDMAFRLYDAASEGSQVGSPITRSVVISDGLFTQVLNFGAAAFTGEARWLDIQVMCAGLGDTEFSSLGRQELTAAPYAHYALSTGALHGYPVAMTAPTAGQVLEWNGATWGPALDDGTTVLAGAGLASDSNGAAVTLTVAFSGTGAADTVARSDHTHTGDQITTAVPTATHALQAATADIAADVEAGAIAPTHLNGVPGNGASGQVLASDGSGGFTWQAAPAARQLVQDFVVASGESVSAGDVVAFLDGQICRPSNGWGPTSTFNANTGYLDVAPLSATDFVIAYSDGDNANHGTLITGTVDEGIISWGTPSVFNEASTSEIAIASLSATDFVIAYTDGGNSDYGTAITGTVSGGSLKWGTASPFNNAATSYIDISSLSPTDFVVAFSDAGRSNDGVAIIGTVSDGSLSWGLESSFYVEAMYIAVTDLSPTSFVVAYRDLDNAGQGTALVGTASGDTVSWGTPSVFNASVYDIAITSLSFTDFVVVYVHDGISLSGMAVVGSASGGIVSWGAESVFNAGDTGSIAITSLSSTKFVVAYTDYEDPSLPGTAVVGLARDRILSWGRESVFESPNAEEMAIAHLSPSNFIISYLGGFDGRAIVGHHRWQLIGTAKASAGAGDTATVVISGVSDGHTGLAPGETYYLQEDGSLGLTPTWDRVGLAISETELILDQMW